MPSLLSPVSDQNKETSEAVCSDLSISASKKVRSHSFAFQDEGKDQAELIDGRLNENGNQASDMAVKKSIMSQFHGLSYSFNHALGDGKMQLTSLRLSSHQVSLLLSSIWVQANSAENTPANFEAMAHSYSIAVLFTRSKTSSHMALVRSFQLAFSRRSIALDQGGLQPSRRRSLFTLASYMLIFSARAGNLPKLIPIVKASLTDKTVDPYLKLVEDVGLQAVCVKFDADSVVYGSREDDVAALESLLAIELDDLHLKETVISHFMTKFEKLSEDELSSMKKQLLEGFSPDDSYPLGAPLFMETPRPCSLAQMEFQAFEEIMPLAAETDEEAFPEANGSQSDRKTSLSISTLDVLSVNEILDSVLETARQVVSFSVSPTPIPYDQMKSQCEALVMGKQLKMSVLHSFKHQQEAKATSEESEKEVLYLPSVKVELSEDLKLISKKQVHRRGQLALCSQEYGQNSFRLPPSSPYDKFLKAAGC
ncbi:hypothetical protein REPUB_Repub20aG0034000 [Reevesia pubescens]